MSEETTQTSVTETAQASSAPATSTQAPSSPAPGATGEVAAAAPEFTPNYKFKFLDPEGNKSEAELEEWLRPFVNKDTNDKFLKLASMAHGLPFVKGKLDKIRGDFEGFKGKTEPVMKALDMINSVYNGGDKDRAFGMLLDAMKFSEEDLYKYVLKKLDYHQMPQEQRQQVDEFNQYKQKALTLEQQNQMLMKQHQEFLVQTKANELGSALANPEVSAAASSYDQRIGKPGAFKDLVIRHGASRFQLDGVDLTPQQAVSEVVNMIGFSQAPAQRPVPEMIPNESVKTPTVIPNIQGKNNAPVKKTVKSLAEIRKLADQ